MRGPDSLAPFEAALDRVDGPVRRALDVGTGTGAGAVEIAKRFQDAEVVGVDVAPAMLEEARRLAPGIEFVEGDASACRSETASSTSSPTRT